MAMRRTIQLSGHRLPIHLQELDLLRRKRLMGGLVMRVTTGKGRSHFGGRVTLYRAAIAAFVLGASISGGAVWAFDNDTIHACVNPTGMPWIVDGPADCKEHRDATHLEHDRG